MIVSRILSTGNQARVSVVLFFGENSAGAPLSVIDRNEKLEQKVIQPGNEALNQCSLKKENRRSQACSTITTGASNKRQKITPAPGGDALFGTAGLHLELGRTPAARQVPCVATCVYFASLHMFQQT